VSARNAGIELDASNDQATIVDNTIFGIPQTSTLPYGIYLAGNDAIVSGNTVTFTWLVNGAQRSRTMTV
jgi:hypothetical protein